MGEMKSIVAVCRADPPCEHPLSEGLVDSPSVVAHNLFGLDSAILRIGRLSHREREVAAQLATGRTNFVISRNLGISEGTVKIHVGHILQKLGLESRTGAAVTAALYMHCRQCGAPCGSD
ncbi:response regulator transcription factor [Streptomyces sp. NPDC059441]|uniref:response regulator transcription factor n=1 Tax=Streptomyces sp. NPDC059441 TaxID=3346829 RepID=UPI003680C260